MSTNKRAIDRQRGRTASRLPVMLAAGCVFMAGCGTLIDRFTGSTNSTPSETANVSSGPARATNTENTASSSTTNTGKCGNDYYPVDTKKREFSITGTKPAEYTLTQQRSGDDSGFVEIREFKSGVTIRNNWVCDDSGLRNVQFSNAMTMPNARFDLETVESSGITIPREWETGKTWSADYDVKGKLDAGPISADATGTVSIGNKIVAIDEKVTAGGKEYQTARVHSDIVLKLKVMGRNVPDTGVSVTYWFAPGVGMVRQETKGAFGGQTTEFMGVR